MRIRNTGQIVDSFTVDVLGDARSWSTVEPSRFNLYPGDEEEVRLTFAPPRSSKVPAGPVPFAIRVLSHEDTAGSVVEEGEIEVAPFSELTAEMTPKTLRAKRRGATEVAVDNIGNVPVTVQLLLEDPEEQVLGSVEPQFLTLAPGKATFAKVLVRPKDTFLKGPAKTLPYQVAVLPEDGRSPTYADGVVLQEQILPGWLLRALVFLIALAVALFVLWQTIFKSAIESAARDAAEAERAAATSAAEEEAAKAGNGNSSGSGGGGEDGGGGAGSDDAAEASSARRGDGLNVLTLGPQVDFRVSTTAAPGAGFVRTEAASQPEDKALMLTDIVFQNPAGDAGTIRVLRNDNVLLEVGLANFRDLDYHFVAPIRFQAGERLAIAVNCANTGPAAAPCSASAYFAGVAVDPKVLEELFQ